MTTTDPSGGAKPPGAEQASRSGPLDPILTVAEAEALNLRFANEPTAPFLAWAWDRFGNRAAIGTSFQGAGLVIMHLAQQQGLRFPVFTIDTGLLFAETVALRKQLEDFFGYPIEVLSPDLTVEQQAAALGPELWLRDPDLCCTQRKVLPLQQKLGSLDAWITGLRRQQSDSRAGIGLIEVYAFDEVTGQEIVKLNPLANWTREAVWDYLKQHRIPYNPLHDQGYGSIGCQPCTRRAAAGENERAGRWTGFKKSECGLHTFLQKKQS
jgi:phosphoadenosine phosphosulfate reductase